MSDKFLILRAFLCLVVVIGHLPIIPLDIQLFGVGFGWINTFDGHLMVVVFMILSGYLIGKQFYNKKYDLTFVGLKRFWVSRILRIVPIYYMAILAELLLYRRHYWFSLEGWNYILQSILFVFDIDRPHNFSGAFWSLSAEMQFYLFAPLIFWILTKLPKKAFIVLGVFFAFGIMDILIRRFVVPFININQLRHFAIHFVFFAFGIMLNFVEPYINWRFITKKFVDIWFGLYLGVLIISSNIMAHRSFLEGKKLFERVPYTLFIVFLSGLTIMLINKFSAHHTTMKQTNKGMYGILEKLGLLSYPLYVIHGLVLSLSYNLLKQNYILGSLTVICGSILTSIGLYYINILIVKKATNMLKPKVS
jgi:peptidoglycan/LPS O-acetylase OafA/YrhL